MTIVTAAVPEDQEAALLDGFRSLISGPKPDGFLRSDLLRSQDGRWVIQTLWRDKEAVLALRASGEPPAARRLLEAVGATPSHDVLTVEVDYDA